MHGETEAIALIKEFEGCHLTAYPDPLTKAEPYTVGWGSIVDAQGKPFKLGQVITQQEADYLLGNKVLNIRIQLERSIPYWEQMSDEQKACLISFAYNLGPNFMYAKSGFETIQKVLREKRWKDVPEALKLYRNPGSSVEAGLLRRRVAEGELWNKGMAKQKLTIRALRNTWLKKETGQASNLPKDKKKWVEEGQSYQVVGWKESPADRAHIQVTLDYGAGTWYVYAPDWLPWGGNPSELEPSGDHHRFDTKVSEFFTWGEVWQWDTNRITDDPDILIRIRKLAAELDKLRRRFGPLIVTSWYRDPVTNANVGGVSNSQHLQGHAADIYPVNYNPGEFEKWIEANWVGGVGKGILSGRGFTHVDLGPRRVWWY